MKRKILTGLTILMIIGLIGTVSADWIHTQTIQVPGKGPDAPVYITVPTYSTPLQKDVLYKVQASGTYTYGNSVSWGIADAEWSNRPGNPVPGQFVGTWYKSDTTEPWLDLMINEEDADWGDFQLDHVYTKLITGDGAALNFRIKDRCTITSGESCYTDNSGFLTVDIYYQSDSQTPVPEFPSTFLPATMIIGFLGAVLLIKRTREH